MTDAADAVGSAVKEAGDYATAKLIDKKEYGWKNAAYSACSSIVSTVTSHIIGKGISKLPWPDKFISNQYNIDFENSSAQSIYNGYSGMQSCRPSIFNNNPSGVDYYDRQLYSDLVAYITSNFVNYDRGVIKKEVEKVFGTGYDYLVEQICNKVATENNCSE